MSSTATINISGSAGPMNTGGQQYNQGEYQGNFPDQGQPQDFLNQGGYDDQVFTNKPEIQDNQQYRQVLPNEGPQSHILYNQGGHQNQILNNPGGPQGQIYPIQGGPQGQIYYTQGGPQGQIYPTQGGPQGQIYPTQGGPQGQIYSTQGGPQGQIYPTQGGPQGQIYPTQGGPQGQIYSTQGGPQSQVYATQGGPQGQVYSNLGGPQHQFKSTQGVPHDQVISSQSGPQSQDLPTHGQHGQVFHVSGNQVTHVEEPVRQVIAPGPKLAFSASNYPPNAQQQQYQQQFQTQQQYQKQFQQNQPQQYMYEQAQYQQPQEYQPIQMVNVQPQMTIQTKDHKKPPVFEAPISKMQIVKKNQSAPSKSPASTMQQSFRSSRSGSLTALDEITDPPHFVKHPEPHQTAIEGDPVSLTARVVPAGDSNLTVQWYKDGQPLSAGSRFNTSFERGFAVLEILYTFKEDSGEYSCVSKNNFGMDQTSPSIINVEVDDSISYLPQEMADNIAAMEASLNSQQISNNHYDKPMQSPKFLRPMPGLFNLKEGQSVHLETMFIPINDSALSIEWYKNGRPLNNGSRFNMISDRGFAILDIVGLIPDDIGDYFCMAKNAVGQSQSNVVKLMVAEEASVVTTSQLPKESVQQLEALDSYLLDDLARPDFRYEETVEEEAPPHFDIKPVDAVVEEGSPAKFLVKVSGYPRPRIQWLLNASSGVSTATQRVYNDGSISYFEFNRCKPVGQSHILVIIKNRLGEETAEATLTVMASNDFRPELKRIDPENPFRKLTTLKKVDVSPELKSAFKKQKPLPIELNKMERDSLVRGKQNKSNESSVAENLYNNVQAKLRRSDRLSYAGATNFIVQQSENINESTKENYTTVASVPSTHPVMQSTEMTFNLGRANYNEDQNPTEFTLQLEE